MGCLLALWRISPRFVIFLLWIFSDRLTSPSVRLGGISASLLPYTTLFYALVYAPGGVDSFGWFIVASACLDLSSHLFSPGTPAPARRGPGLANGAQVRLGPEGGRWPGA